MAQYNQYYLSNSANFQNAIEWASRQRQDNNLNMVAYCEIQSLNVLKANAPHEWDDAYDFVRTAASTMRLGLLKGTNLFQLYSPKFAAKQANFRAFNVTPAGSQERMNAGNLLAANKEETRLFTSHFDTLYAYHRILYSVNAAAAGEQQPRNVTGQMIVINTHHNVVWHITSALYFEMDGRRVTMAIPYIAVMRYDLAQGITAFVAIRPDDDKQGREYDEVIKKIKEMKL